MSEVISPLPLNTYDLWLTVRDTTTLSLSGTSVLSWYDKSPNAWHATSANSGTKPSYATLDGKQCISFRSSGLTSERHTLDGTFVHTTAPLTAFMVYSLSASAGSFARILNISSSLTNSSGTSAPRATVFIKENSTANIRANRNNINLSQSTGLSFSTWYVATSIFNGSQHTLRVNGTAFTSVTTTSLFGTSVYRIGANTASLLSSDIFQGGIAEVIMVRSALNTTDITTVENYLRTAYSI